MTGRYTPLHSSIWSDPQWVALEPEAQRLYLLIISQPDLSYAGVTSYTPRRWARMSAATTVVEIDAALSLLVDARFVFLDDFTEEVMVRSFVRHNKVYEQKQLRNALKRAFDGILSPALKRAFWSEQSDDVKALVGSPAEACPRAPGEPAASHAASPPEGSGQEPDLDLEPDSEPGEGPEPAGRQSAVHDALLPKNCDSSLLDELDDIVDLLLDVHPATAVDAAVQRLVDDRRRFPWPSDARTAIKALLGPTPVQAQREARVCFDESIEQQIERLQAQRDLVADDRDREAIDEQLASLLAGLERSAS